MAMFTKQGGAWRGLTAHVKVNGVWRAVRTVYAKANGEWRDVSSPPFTWDEALAAGGSELDLTLYTQAVDGGMLFAEIAPAGPEGFSIPVVLKTGTYQVMAVGGGSAGSPMKISNTYFQPTGSNDANINNIAFAQGGEVLGGMGGVAAALTLGTFRVNAQGTYTVTIGAGGAYGTDGGNGGDTTVFSESAQEAVFTAAGGICRETVWDVSVSGYGCRLTRPSTTVEGDYGSNGATHEGRGGEYTALFSYTYTRRNYGSSSNPNWRYAVTASEIGGGGGEGSWFPYGTTIQIQTQDAQNHNYGDGQTGYGYGAGGGGGGRYNGPYWENNVMTNQNGDPGSPGAIWIKKVG